MKKNYFLGLDIGTDSIGWAVTDNEYNLLKFNGKAMWGIHLFEAGQTAESRRVHRSEKRRRDRARQRRDILRDFFKEEINKVDPDFFERMDDSFFHREDKKINQKNTLFNDSDYTDKDYYKEFPTIYHLRKKLTESNEKLDIRLIYLAIEHILKHRGHFLYNTDNMDIGSNFDEIYREWCDEVYNIFNEDMTLTDTEPLKNILKNPMGTKAKNKELNLLFGSDTTKALMTLLSGGKVKLEKLFEGQYEESDIKDVSFKDASMDDENKDKLFGIIGEDNLHLLEKTKALYDWGILAELLKGKKYVSEAKADIYDKHATDLVLLKGVIKDLIPDKYKEVFKDSANGKNYAAYVGIAKSSGKKQPVKSCTYDEFTNYIKSLLKNYGDDERVKYILDEREKGTFMPKQVTKDNSVIPYQVNLAELRCILDNAKKHYKFLNEKDKYGTVADKIESLLTFRIPYYVGPLNSYHGKYAWIKKKGDEPIRPWNFEDMVDTEGSAERFIERMTNKCTYIGDEPVLPKNSILYSRYMVLNELNNLRINGEKLHTDLKNGIYNNTFLTHTQPKAKHIIDYIKSYTGDIGEIEISGIDEDLKSNMKSYIDFKKIIGDKVHDEAMVDEIIRLITIFGNEKKMLANQIKKYYGDSLSESEIKRISRLNYGGWGRFSRKLLKDVYSEIDHKSIIELMAETSDNFMQIINNDEYGINRQLEEIKRKNLLTKGIGTYSSLEDLYVSPANKKRIWRVMVIVKEIVKVMDCEPEKIFIEMARGPEEIKERTTSRKRQLQALYKTVKDDKELLDSLESESDSTLRQKKLFLYYLQMGKCMYSGKRLELSDLARCDIDHIIPRSIKSDDSLNNTVLVFKKLNADKSNKYPIPNDVINDDAKKLWFTLLQKGFITKEKYSRLVRQSGLTLEEKTEFVARQLVDTRQTTKVVADIFKQMYESSEIVYVKAGDVSKFRQGGYLKNVEKEQYKDDYIVKVREINDYHHAKDAYLNIVVGNIYNEKFNHNPKEKFRHNLMSYISSGRHYNLARIFEYDVENANWIAGHDGTIVKIKNILNKNNILYTEMPYEVRGGFFKQMPVPMGKGQYPLKTKDNRYNIETYGGYTDISGAYFALVRHTVKNKPVKSIEMVPVYLNSDNLSEDDLLNYFKTKGLKNIEILIPKIKMRTLFKIDGTYVRIRGRSDNRILYSNAMQLIVGQNEERYLKKIVNAYEGLRENRNEAIISNDISKEKNIEIYDVFVNKLKTTSYGKWFKPELKNLCEARSDFIDLSLEEQIKVLYEITKIFRCNQSKGDLKLLKKSSQSGIMRISKKIDSKQDIKIINQSPTGLFENEIDISKL